MQKSLKITMQLLILFAAILLLASCTNKQQFYDAISTGDTQTVEKIITKNTKIINEKFDLDAQRKEIAPLHLAVYKDKPEIVTLLLSKGADINIQDVNLWTPLHEASIDGYYDIAVILIDNGADIKALTKYKDTPLHIAARYGFPDIVKLLIQKGADVNAKNDKDRTPMYWAKQNGNRQIIAILGSNGGN